MCKRYEVDNSGRELHGALLDARLLADVYLLMTGGQNAMDFAEPVGAERGASGGSCESAAAELPNLPTPVIRPNAEEQAAHAALLERIAAAAGRPAVWHSTQKVAK